MSLGKGINSYGAYGGEITYGSAGVLDLFTRIIGGSLEHKKDPFYSESQADGWQDDLYFSAGRNEGDQVVEGNYTDHELLWHSLFGTYTFSLDTPVAGAHTHAFTFVPSTNSFPVGISWQSVRGIGGTDEITYLGMHVTKATIEFAPRQVEKITFSMVGQGIVQGAPTASSFPTFKPVLPAHKTTLSIGGNTLTILSGTIEIEVPRPNDREHYGEALYKEPVIQGRPKATFSLNCEFNDATGADTEQLYQDFLDETELTTLAIVHEGDIVTGATKYTQTITGTKAWITGDGPSVQGPGIVPITINGEITEGLLISYINGTGAIVT